MLAVQNFGEDSKNPTLVIVHGLFGSGRNWRAIARHFARNRKVITVDLRNHGDSFWDDDNSYTLMANDLAEVIQSERSPVDVLGHSMGGKAAMVLSISNSALVNRMIVADISPVAYKHDQTSNVKIMQSLPLADITRRSEADEILAQSIREPSVRAFFLQSLILSEHGNSWQLNLDALEANMPKIVGFPDMVGVFNGPTLFLRGGASNYVTADYVPKIKALFPNYKMNTIEGAGHWLHAEKPREFIAVVNDFIG